MPADTRRQFRLEPAGWRAYGEAINAAESEGLAWQAVSIAKLLPLTGCRLDEIVSLRWAEVDFDARRFRFDPQRVKSGSLRPAGREALAILQETRGFAAKRAADSAFPVAEPRAIKPIPVSKEHGNGFSSNIRRTASAMPSRALPKMIAAYTRAPSPPSSDIANAVRT